MSRALSLRAHIARFNLIARQYNWFFGFQKRRYLSLLDEQLPRLPVPPGAKVLDVGCGPGPFAAAFAARGFAAVGTDASPAMVAVARRRGLEAFVSDAAGRIRADDASFDLVVAAFLLHGLPAEHRIAALVEMRRVSKGPVLLHDFSRSDERFPEWSVTGLLERLEGSDYESFIRTGIDDMRSVFDTVEVIDHRGRISWYLCR